MKIGKLKIENSQSGLTLILVILLLSAILSISLGIFTVVFGQIRISGEIADSFTALYAADQGIEQMLYRDRVLREICTVEGPDCFPAQTFNVMSGACYTTRVSKVSGITDVVVSGQYRCGSSPRVVKRGFSVTYITVPTP